MNNFDERSFESYKVNQDDEINFLLIFKTLKRNKKLIFTLSSIVSLFSIIFVMTAQPKWIGSFNIVTRDKNNQNINSLQTVRESILGVSERNNKETEKLILKSSSVLMPIYNYVKNYYKKENIDTTNMSFKKWVNELEVDFKNKSQVLTVKYKNKDKNLILNVLKKVSTKYQSYSKSAKEKNLNKTISFLEKQVNLMEEKSANSLKNLNEFSIENGLGDIDGFVELGNFNKPFNTFNNSGEMGNQNFPVFNNSGAMDNQNFPSLNTSRETSDAGLRYKRQFNLLEKYETQYLDFSSKLNENSKVLKQLKNKINTVKSTLKRPNEILIEFKQRKSLAKRDKNILEDISRNLQVLQLEKIKSLDPWEMISEPNIDEKPIFPKKKETVIFTFILSFLTGCLISLVKEKRSGIIYDFDNMRSKLNCNFIDTIYSSYPTLGVSLIRNLIFQNISDKNIKVGIINLSNNNDKNFIHELNKTEFCEFSLLDLSKVDSFKNFYKIFILIEEGELNNKNLIILNQITSALNEKVMGWFLFDSKTEVI